MRLTKDQVKKMLPGQILTINCANTAELDSTYQTAAQARRETDKHNISIARSGTAMTITISVTEKDKTS